MKNVISEVVGNGFCIGCGVCASQCPTGGLAMEWNVAGEFNPVSADRCLAGCLLCLSVCPFAPEAINETQIAEGLFARVPGIRHRKETGFLLSTHVGYSPTRKECASGGLATWLLEKLLVSRQVDAVVCPGPTPDPNRLFSYRVVKTAEDLRQCRGSAYYPVELSGVISFILEHPGRYAVTGLPCFIKGLRLASIKNPVLNERIAFTVGLVCGQLKSKAYSHYLASLAGVEGPLASVHFRGKDPGQPASNFFFSCENTSGKSGRLFWNQGVSQAWLSRWFTPQACLFCDDVFAETADIVFMDAWLPEFVKNPAGTSLVLSRNKRLTEILEEAGVSAEIDLKKIPVEKVIQSQAGVLKAKRKDLAIRLRKREEDGLPSPKKRVSASYSFPGDYLARIEQAILSRMAERSRELVTAHGIESLDAGKVQASMTSDLARLRRLQQLRGILGIPGRILRKFGFRRNA
jgi:coenzyme F420-reducing hydrogenase beta subunit